MTTHPKRETDAHSRLHRRMVALLSALDYNFARFSLPDFVYWVEAQQNERKIVLVPRSLPSSLSGAWLRAEQCDYIFYEKDTHTLHQLHIQLHELSHILCGHAALAVGHDDGELLAPKGQEPALPAALLRRSYCSHQAEQEAELLASLMQLWILQADGRDVLIDGARASSQTDVLQDLLYLHAWLQAACPQITPYRLNGWEHREDLDLCIYRTLIHILDGRKKLVDHLERTGYVPTGAACTPQRKAAMVQQAGLLQKLLAVKRAHAYVELIRACCQISRQIRRDSRALLPHL